MAKTKATIALAALVATLPAVWGAAEAQRASKPGAVENQDSGSEAPARSLSAPRSTTAPEAAKPGAAPAAKDKADKKDDKKGEEKKK